MWELLYSYLPQTAHAMSQIYPQWGNDSEQFTRRLIDRCCELVNGK